MGSASCNRSALSGEVNLVRTLQRRIDERDARRRLRGGNASVGPRPTRELSNLASGFAWEYSSTFVPSPQANSAPFSDGNRVTRHTSVEVRRPARRCAAVRVDPINSFLRVLVLSFHRTDGKRGKRHSDCRRPSQFDPLALHCWLCAWEHGPALRRPAQKHRSQIRQKPLPAPTRRS